MFIEAEEDENKVRKVCISLIVTRVKTTLGLGLGTAICTGWTYK